MESFWFDWITFAKLNKRVFFLITPNTDRLRTLTKNWICFCTDSGTALEAMTANVNLTGLASFSSLSYPNLAVQVWNMSGDSKTSAGKKVFGFGYNNRTNSYENYFAPNVSSNTMDSAIILSRWSDGTRQEILRYETCCLMLYKLLLHVT